MTLVGNHVNVYSKL